LALLVEWCALVYLALCCTSTSARAADAEAPRLVVVMEPDNRDLADRIQLELEAMGFDSRVLLQAETTADQLAKVAVDAEAVASAQIRLTETSLEFRIHDRTTGKTLQRMLERTGNVGDATLATHAVELLRASLLELSLPDAARGDVEPTPALLEAAGLGQTSPSGSPPSHDAATPVASSSVGERMHEARPDDTARAIVTAGPALIGGAGDLPAVPALSLSAEFVPGADVGVGVLTLIPLQAMSHSAPEGSSETRVTLVGAHAAWNPRAAFLEPVLGGALVVAFLETTGQPKSTNLQANSDRALTVGAALRAGVGMRLTRSLRLVPGLLSGAQHRYFSVDYADRSGARWGAWWWAATLSLEGALL
jgi:hypothetical protein